MGREPWYRGVPPVEVDLDVDGKTTHRVVWSEGRVVLVDHPDPTGEMALVALGAETCPCFEVLEAWRSEESATAWQSTEWYLRPRELQQELRFFRDRLRGLRSSKGQQQLRSLLTVAPGRGFVSRDRAMRAEMARDVERQLRERLVSALPTLLLERLALGLVVRRLRAGEPVTDMARIRLREQVVDAITRCVRAWGPSRRPPSVDVQLWLTTTAAPQVVGLVEHQLGYVEAVLPSRWLTAVHARGLAVVDDCFVVDAQLDRADHGTVEAVHFAHTCTEGWTPIQRTMQAHRTHKGTWHLR